MKRRWLIACALAVAAAGAAGVWYGDAIVDRLGGAEARARLAERACGFTTESGRVMVCYDLHVPENRAVAGSRLIRLPVIVFRAPDAERKPDPVVLIGGGPGAIGYIEPRYAEIWRGKFKDLPWLEGRDLVVYDQRGVGAARPALDCPEVDATRAAPMNLDAIKAAMVACRDRLRREGADFGAYDTNANADDLDALRRLFGAAQVNLWAQSYGSRVALVLLRRGAPGIRSLIVDGAYPPEIAGKLHFAAAFVRTLELVFDACERDALCREDYPDLRAEFQRVLGQLRQKPVAVVSDPAPLLPAQKFDVDDLILLSVIENMLYTADGAGKFPWLIDRVAQGKYEALAEPLADWDLVAYGPFITTGASYLVDCNDTPAPDDAEERALARAQPQFARWIDYALAVKPCPVWTGRGAPALDRTPVKSDVPALLVAGWYDLATPPEWAAIAARSLTRAQLVLVRGASHDAAEHGCAQAALEAFLADPARNVESSCGQSATPPPFKRKSEDD